MGCNICHAGAGHDGMTISWATGNAVILDAVPQNASLPEIGSAVRCFSASPVRIAYGITREVPWASIISAPKLAGHGSSLVRLLTLRGPSAGWQG